MQAKISATSDEIMTPYRHRGQTQTKKAKAIETKHHCLSTKFGSCDRMYFSLLQSLHYRVLFDYYLQIYMRQMFSL